jgi:hypothetical protein
MDRIDKQKVKKRQDRQQSLAILAFGWFTFRACESARQGGLET